MHALRPRYQDTLSGLRIGKQDQRPARGWGRDAAHPRGVPGPFSLPQSPEGLGVKETRSRCLAGLEVVVEKQHRRQRCCKAIDPGGLFFQIPGIGEQVSQQPVGFRLLAKAISWEACTKALRWKGNGGGPSKGGCGRSSLPPNRRGRLITRVWAGWAPLQRMQPI